MLCCIGDDAVVYANLAATCNRDAVKRAQAQNGTGYRQKFKDTYENALKAVELDPRYERGWVLLARGYLGYRELPRAKKAYLCQLTNNHLCDFEIKFISN